MEDSSFLGFPVAEALDHDYEAYWRDDRIKTHPRNDTILSSRELLLERLIHVEPKASYGLQEATEQLLHYGALLRTQVLDTFGNLLYIHYDDFSVREVEAVRRVYRETLERRYNIFQLAVSMLRKPDMRPWRICADIYAEAEACLRSSADVCRGIRKRHDLSHPDDHLVMHASNVTYLVFRSSKIARQYPGGFSLPALLTFLHRGVLSITPGLLSGLLHHVKYDDYDADVLLAERELVRHLNEVASTSKRSSQAVLEPMSPKDLKRHHSVASLLRYYISIHVESLASNELRRHALLIVKHLIDDIGVIDENIHLLGNVYENGTIHVGYLFDLVLPDDVLHDDVIEAKRYLVDKLNELDVVERYLRVSKYQQATPAHLLMEITGQLQDVGFAENIAMALRIHARFWRRSYMVESLHELLRLFDAYENLRRVARYKDIMRNLDKIRQSLSDMQDVPVEILCNAPRACLRNGLRMLLDCKLVSPEIKELIGDFLKQLSPKGAPLDDVCLTSSMKVIKFRRTTDIQDVDVSENSLPVESSEAHAETPDLDDISELETTEIDTTEQETTTRSTPRKEEDDLSAAITQKSEESSELLVENSDETTERLSDETGSSLEESVESPSTKAAESTIYETTEPVLTMTTTRTTTTTTATTTMIDDISESRQEETTTAATSTVAATTTTTAATTTSATTVEDEEVPNIDIELEKKLTITMSAIHDEDSDSVGATSMSPMTPVVIALKSSCELGECSAERSSEESDEHEDTSTTLAENATTTTIVPTTQGLAIFETTSETWTTSPGPSSSQKVSGETTAPVASETLVAEGEKCTESSCSEECAGSKSESVESPSCWRTGDCSGKSCSGCDSLMEDCDDQSSDFEDSKTERPANSTGVECRPEVVCEKESSAKFPAGCDAPKSGRSDNERCVKVCASREKARSSCEDQDGDCSGNAELPTVELKLERARNRSVCEIPDPHHRRQMRRLARMRAISAATSRQDDVSASLRRWPRRGRGRLATEELYELLANRLPHDESDRTRTRTGTAEEQPSPGAMMKMKLETGGGRKKRTFGRKQRHQLYTLKEKLARRHGGGKSNTARQTYRSTRTRSARRGHTDRISSSSRRDPRSIVVAPLREGAMMYWDLSV
ncbi:hypothetical protein EAI_12480 [Harpegnathos saltator]|uniref:Uncharacterized protein n=1 Tax=Harpegnathos saltator TaxID=610380 RepID=E2B4H4_HARSA|nr:hypothetical protein EAI_12480 [Harpegnathos saltator]